MPEESRPVTAKYDGVIFDMDGTLVRPLLDFGAIRAELGIDAGDGIIEAIAAMPPARRAEAEEGLTLRELAAAKRAILMPSAGETLAAVRAAGLKTALLTRNTQPAMRIVLDKFKLAFDLAWAREDGPIKPGPQGVLRACAALGIAPGRTMCVGDFEYDISAARSAGAASTLLTHDPDPPAFADQADHVIRSLSELPELLGIHG